MTSPCGKNILCTPSSNQMTSTWRKITFSTPSSLEVTRPKRKRGQSGNFFSKQGISGIFFHIRGIWSKNSSLFPYLFLFLTFVCSWKLLMWVFHFKLHFYVFGCYKKIEKKKWTFPINKFRGGASSVHDIAHSLLICFALW